jgi:hypothetical protein
MPRSRHNPVESKASRRMKVGNGSGASHQPIKYQPLAASPEWQTHCDSTNVIYCPGAYDQRLSDEPSSRLHGARLWHGRWRFFTWHVGLRRNILPVYLGLLSIHSHKLFMPIHLRRRNYAATPRASKVLTSSPNVRPKASPGSSNIGAHTQRFIDLCLHTCAIVNIHHQASEASRDLYAVFRFPL